MIGTDQSIILAIEIVNGRVEKVIVMLIVFIRFKPFLMQISVSMVRSIA